VDLIEYPTQRARLPSAQIYPTTKIGSHHKSPIRLLRGMLNISAENDRC